MKQTQDLDAGKGAAYFAGGPFEPGPPVWSAAVAVGYSHSPDETARSSRVPRLKFRALVGMRQLVPQIWHLAAMCLSKRWRALADLTTILRPDTVRVANERESSFKTRVHNKKKKNPLRANGSECVLVSTLGLRSDERRTADWPINRPGLSSLAKGPQIRDVVPTFRLAFSIGHRIYHS